MLPNFQIGPIAIQATGFIVLLSFWIALRISESLAPYFNAEARHIYNLVLVGLIAGAVGARLGYLLQSPAAFASNLLSVFSPNLTMLNAPAGLLTAAIAALIYGQRKKYPFWPTLDTLTPGLAVMSIGFGAANLASGSAFGSESNLPWAVELWGMSRHPAQVYHMLAAGLILIAIWPRRIRRNFKAGATFLTFLALSAAARLFLEAFRGDSLLVIGNIRSAQITAWVILAVALFFLGNKFTSNEGTHGPNSD